MVKIFIKSFHNHINRYPSTQHDYNIPHPFLNLSPITPSLIHINRGRRWRRLIIPKVRQPLTLRRNVHTPHGGVYKHRLSYNQCVRVLGRSSRHKKKLNPPIHTLADSNPIIAILRALHPFNRCIRRHNLRV